ncbi:MAG TPA: hypothetical protein VH951_14585 [Dehalococcoidia bacterium]
MPTYEYTSVRFADHEPVRGDGASTWWVRAQNFVLAYSTVAAGGSLTAEVDEFEYMLVLVEGSIAIDSQLGSGQATGDSVVIVPPGRSTVHARTGATLYRVFAPPTQDLVALCANAAAYETPREDVAPFQPWPMPHDGYKLRIYQYDQLPAGHRNVFRSRNVMISYAGHPGDPPRDPRRFSPHSHADFEQISLELWGSYTHHLRYPWEPDSTAWRDDTHFTVRAPGITVMPVNVVHTSQAVDPNGSRLSDVFAPPRLDFTLAGNCYNNDEYPLPDGSPAPAGGSGQTAHEIYREASTLGRSPQLPS